MKTSMNLISQLLVDVRTYTLIYIYIYEYYHKIIIRLASLVKIYKNLIWKKRKMIF